MSFTVTKQTIDGEFPRKPNTSLKYNENGLKLVYNKYKTTTTTIPDGKVKINLVFAHGTGMNKSIWKYHIKRLYDLQNPQWQLNTVVSVDAYNHGDSAVENKGKLGFTADWPQGAQDLLHVIKHEQQANNEFPLEDNSKTILVGHSMGGYQAFFAAFQDPGLIDSVVVVEPVLYGVGENTPKFNAILAKMSPMIIDTFETEDDYNDYFEKFSFYKNFNKEVLKDFMEDEKLVEGNVFKTKATNSDQIITYFGAWKSLETMMAIMPLIEVPVCHVIGTKASWNPPEATPHIRKAIPSHLVHAVDIEGGEHLVNGEKPQETTEVIANFISQRVTNREKDAGDRLVNKFEGDRVKYIQNVFREAKATMKKNAKL